MGIYPKKTYRWLWYIWKDAQYHSPLGKCKSKQQWNITSPVRKAIIKTTIRIGNTTIGQKGTTVYCWCDVNWCYHYNENSVETSPKLRNRTTTWSRNSTLEYLFKYRKNTIRKDICTSMFIAVLFTMAKIWMQTNSLSIS